MSTVIQRRRAILAVAATLVFATAGLAQMPQSPWRKGAPFPEPDEELYGVAVKSKLYVIGGGASIAKIASITIRGVVAGGPTPGENFGFVSHQIGAFRVTGITLPLDSGAANDNREFVSTTDDVSVLEV